MSQGRENGEGGFDALEQALGSSAPAARPRDSGRHPTRPDGAAARASSRPPPTPTERDVSESLGRSNAAYASAGARPIPSTRPPRELDQDVPAVIVAPDEFPSSSRHKTARMNGPLLQRPQTPTVTIPRSSVPAPAPQAGYPYGSSPPPPFATRPSGPPPALGPQAHDPRTSTAPRPRQPTLLVRKRGPSAAAKIFAFLAVLLLVLAAGFIGILMRKPEWIGLTRAVKETPAPAVRIVPVVVPADPAPPVTVTPAPNAAPTVSAAPSATAKPKKPAAARPQPAPTAAPAPAPVMN